MLICYPYPCWNWNLLQEYFFTKIDGPIKSPKCTLYVQTTSLRQFPTHLPSLCQSCPSVRWVCLDPGAPDVAPLPLLPPTIWALLLWKKSAVWLGIPSEFWKVFTQTPVSDSHSAFPLLCTCESSQPDKCTEPRLSPAYSSLKSSPVCISALLRPRPSPPWPLYITQGKLHLLHATPFATQWRTAQGTNYFGFSKEKRERELSNT